IATSLPARMVRHSSKPLTSGSPRSSSTTSDPDILASASRPVDTQVMAIPRLASADRTAAATRTSSSTSSTRTYALPVCGPKAPILPHARYRQQPRFPNWNVSHFHHEPAVYGRAMVSGALMAWLLDSDPALRWQVER